MPWIGQPRHVAKPVTVPHGYQGKKPSKRPPWAHGIRPLSTKDSLCKVRIKSLYGNHCMLMLLGFQFLVSRSNSGLAYGFTRYDMSNI